jgi:hypothetical protein
MTDEETERALAAMHKLDEPARRALNRFVRIAYCGRPAMAFDPAAAGRAWSLLDPAASLAAPSTAGHAGGWWRVAPPASRATRRRTAWPAWRGTPRPRSGSGSRPTAWRPA